MVFSSSVFLLVFLPLVLVAYFIVPGRAAKNCLLLLASLVFYAWGEPTYIVLMVVSIFANWLFGVLIDRASEAGTRKTLLIFDLVVNLALLCFFKYEGFLAENINALLGSSVIPDLELPLPIGISFYTLQAVSYVIDVYRREVPAQRNIVYLGMYIAMFPQLVAGPIVRYSTIQEQVLHRKETLKGFCSGLRLFCVGLAKKVLLANVVAILAAKMLKMGGAEIGLVGAWAGLIAYTFQIYFDFGGYSDMAIGLGKMFGFQYLRNFIIRICQKVQPSFGVVGISRSRLSSATIFTFRLAEAVSPRNAGSSTLASCGLLRVCGMGLHGILFCGVSSTVSCSYLKSN